MFGEFLGALGSEAADLAGSAIAAFDAALRRHMADEEERVYGDKPGSLAPAPGETHEARQTRELLLEHVQVRELSGMVVRLLTENRDVDGARRLAASLARRWDAHATREEREIFGGVASER